jgi:hypothetical protein
MELEPGVIVREGNSEEYLLLNPDTHNILLA